MSSPYASRLLDLAIRTRSASVVESMCSLQVSRVWVTKRCKESRRAMRRVPGRMRGSRRQAAAEPGDQGGLDYVGGNKDGGPPWMTFELSWLVRASSGRRSKKVTPPI